MVIIRRNEDGSIANPEVANTTTHKQLKEVCQHYQNQVEQPPLFNEIAMKVNNAKDKPSNRFKTGFKR